MSRELDQAVAKVRNSFFKLLLVISLKFIQGVGVLNFFVCIGSFIGAAHLIDALYIKIGISNRASAIPISCAISLITTYIVRSHLDGKFNVLNGTSKLKRKYLSGTGETVEKQLIKQLNKFAADSSRKFGQRLGRDGVRIKRTANGKGDILVPWSKFFAGFLLVGKSGAGKSSGILYPLVEELLELNPSLLMIADAKGDYTQMLFKRERRKGFEDVPDNNIGKKVYLLNPVDRDSIQFNLEIRTSTEATKLAEIFIREHTNNTNQYFTDTARNVLAGIILGLHEVGQLNWESLLAVVSNDSLEVISSLLQLTEEGRLCLSDVSPNAPEQATGVLSTMKKEIKFLAPIARAWKNPDFSVREFVKKGDGIILLRYHNQHSELTSKMIQIFFELALYEIAPLEDYNPKTYVFFADELQNFPRLDLPFSTSFLRSKCLAHVLSHQDVNRMQKVYGKENYNSIFENLESFVILNSGTETADWFSKSLGDRRVLEESSNSGSSMGHGISLNNSQSHAIKEERTVNYGRIINLPVPIQTGKVTGLFKTAGVDVTEMTWDQGITKSKPIYKDFIEADWVKI